MFIYWTGLIKAMFNGRIRKLNKADLILPNENQAFRIGIWVYVPIMSTTRHIWVSSHPELCWSIEPTYQVTPQYVNLHDVLIGIVTALFAFPFLYGLFVLTLGL